MGTSTPPSDAYKLHCSERLARVWLCHRSQAKFRHAISSMGSFTRRYLAGSSVTPLDPHWAANCLGFSADVVKCYALMERTWTSFLMISRSWLVCCARPNVRVSLRIVRTGGVSSLDEGGMAIDEEWIANTINNLQLFRSMNTGVKYGHSYLMCDFITSADSRVRRIYRLDDLEPSVVETLRRELPTGDGFETAYSLVASCQKVQADQLEQRSAAVPPGCA